MTMQRLATLICLAGIITALILVSGCTNTLKALEGADYICITGNIDGYFTRSGFDGRGIKIPDGETLTPETVEALCN
jgi:hypothetical protein